MRHFLILGLFAALLACTASAAFTHSSTHTFNTSADLDRKMVLTVDFGATAHSETFSLTCQYTTTAGAAWWIMDIDRMSSATTPAEWNAGHVGWQFTTPSASGGTSTQTYITPSYSGVHHFVVYFYPSATSGLFPTTITVTVNNASQAATATNANSQIDNYLTLGIGQSGNSAGFVEHYHGAARIEALLAANTDELMYNFNVNFGATAVPLNVRIWGLNLPNASAGTTGSGPMVAEFHVMSVGGGSTPQGTCTVNDAAAPNNQGLSAAYTTPALSGNQQFRVVVKGGTGFTANKVGLFFISWQTPGTIPQTAQSPDTAAPPVTITPGGMNISSTTALTASGGSGTPTYNWSIQGTPPTGVSLSGTTGTTVNLQVTGTPTGTVTVRCANGTTGEFDQETYTLTGGGGGGGALNISTTSLPNATVNVAYNFTVSGTGGTPPYTWSATGLPAGMSINPSTGAITGTPTTTGTFPVTVTCTDSATPTPNTTSKNFNLVVGTGGGGGGGGFGTGKGGGGGGGCAAGLGAAPLGLLALLGLGCLARRRRND